MKSNMVQEKEAWIDRLVKPNFLDTERLRGIGYGNLILRKSQHRIMAEAVTLSVIFFLTLLFGYVGYDALQVWLNPEESTTVVRTQNDVFVMPPPPMQQPQTPPPALPAKPKQAPDVGTVKPSKEVPPQQTIATQEKLKEAIVDNVTTGKDTTGDVAAIQPMRGTGNSEAVIETEPNPDEFIAVEKNPEFVTRIMPTYPEMARRAGMEGRVVLKVLIDKTGKPTKFIIVARKPDTDIFDAAATASVMNSTYTPAMQNGKPVGVWLVVPMTFKLNSK
jgi:periplasmic protein TonB